MLVSPEKVFSGGSETQPRDNEFSYEVKLQITKYNYKLQLQCWSLLKKCFQVGVELNRETI